MLKGPIAKSTVRTSFVLALRLLLQAGSLLLIARALGPYIFGSFAGIAALAILLGTLSTFGTHLVLLAEASQGYRRRLRVLPYCVSTTLIAGSVLFTMYFVIFATVFRDSPVSEVIVLLIGITEIILMPLISFPSVQLQARRQIVKSQLVFLIPLAIRFVVILAITLFATDQPLLLFALGCMAGGILGVLVVSISEPELWPALRHWRIAKPIEVRRAAGYAMLNMTAAGPSEIDKSIAARLLPLATAGVYSGAARITGAVSLPVNAMVHAALPTLFQQARTLGYVQPRLLVALFTAALVYGSVIALALWAIVPVIAWMFGESYVGVKLAVSWLCCAIPGTTLRISSGSVLLAQNRPWARVCTEMSGIVVILIAAVALVPAFGLLGMIIAYVSAEWIMAILTAILVVKYQNLKKS